MGTVWALYGHCLGSSIICSPAASGSSIALKLPCVRASVAAPMAKSWEDEGYLTDVEGEAAMREQGVAIEAGSRTTSAMGTSKRAVGIERLSAHQGISRPTEPAEYTMKRAAARRLRAIPATKYLV